MKPRYKSGLAVCFLSPFCRRCFAAGRESVDVDAETLADKCLPISHM